ncbi:sensor domain-containing diguanylate cyclase [Serratia rubidaea]|uniref:sensor domain-containing diguanylate cyclase n=1 Tax=Serratia rubidaea TaxID=61652 RepID=UPI00234914CD|nr:GGDEF domain-containing protein [Serratia rubidaea]MDC6110213.1 diguanylate cyclase [Serratia rubidaea]
MTQPPPESAKSGTSPLLFQAAVFVVIVVVTLLVFNIWQSWHARKLDLQSADNGASNLARSLAQHAYDTFKQVDNSLLELKERAEHDGLGPAQQRRLQKVMHDQVNNSPQLHGSFIFDAQGRWVVTSFGRTGAHANNGDRAYFQYHQRHNDNNFYIGKVIRSRSTDDLVIPISRRLNNPDGSFAGVVLATLYVDYFRNFYDDFALEDQDALSLLLADGTILYRRPYAPESIGKNVSLGVLFRQILPYSTFGNATLVSKFDGVERIYGYSRVPHYPLVIAAGLSKHDVLSSWRKDTGLFALGGSILLAILLALGITLIRQINHSLQTEAELVRTRDQLTQMNQTLEELALLDGLTGLANRRRFDMALANHSNHAARYARNLALLILDIDYFKQYNDIYGHVAGDRCLQQIGQLLQAMPNRVGDLVARYGGEELTIILPDTDLAGAMGCAERVLAHVRQMQIPHEGSPLGQITVSIGVAVQTPGNAADSTPVALIKQADAALYQAKKNGKNQVCHA